MEKDVKIESKKLQQIEWTEFYHEYYGQKISHLEILHKYSVLNKRKNVFLVGDSSLDNKHWLLNGNSELKKPKNGYEDILLKSYPDVCYHLNNVLEQNKSEYFCINCAVEESTVNERKKNKLLKQDEFVQEKLQKDDIIIASLGGNDIALKPTFSTIYKMLWLTKCSYKENILNGTAWGLEYFIDMMKKHIERYLENLIKNNKPKKIIVCTIYFPHLKKGGWADYVLDKLNYNTEPETLQNLIRSVFTFATKKINIEGVEVVAIPLFEILDCSENSNDYLARVEPSDEGGRKMAEAFFSNF